MVGTSSWNQTVHQKKIPFKSDEHPIRSPFLLVIYTVYIYIYTYTLCNPILNNSLCNPIQIPVSTTVKTTTKPSFSHVFLWVFPLFCWFFSPFEVPSQAGFHPKRRGVVAPGHSCLWAQVGVWLSTGWFNGISSTIKWWFFMECFTRNEWWSWWDVMSTLDFSKPRLRLFKKGRVPFI